MAAQPLLQPQDAHNQTLLGHVHPANYQNPTQAEGIKAAANGYMRTRLTPFVQRLFSRFFAWRR